MRILVPLDPTRVPRRSVDIAAALAGRDGEIELVSVTGIGLPGALVDAYLHAERDRHPSRHITTRRFPGPGVVETLLRRIAEVRPDVLVIDSHGRGPVGELVLGSVSADLVRSSPAPTLLIGPECRPDATPHRLVVAVDGSPDSLAALRVAVALSPVLGTEVELVEVAQDVPTGSDVAESAELHRLAESVDPPVRRWDVLHGHDPSRALVDHVRPDRGAVLVLGSHGRSDHRPAALGGVAARTVRHSPVPVLVVSPEAADATEARRREAQPVS